MSEPMSERTDGAAVSERSERISISVRFAQWGTIVSTVVDTRHEPMVHQ